MTPEEREQLNDLCRRVIAEKDQTRLTVLVHQMNELLDRFYSRTTPADNPNTGKQ